MFFSTRNINRLLWIISKFAARIHNAGKFNILSENDLIPGIRDTVYTDLDCWLELKVNKTDPYQHWRNGKTETY